MKHFGARVFGAVGILCGLFLVSKPAGAGVFIEPFAGYNVGAEHQTSTKDYDVKGGTFGGRVGYGLLGFSGGFQYSAGSDTVTLKDINNKEFEADYKMKQMGVFINYTAPIWVRIWFTYFLKADTLIPDLTIDDPDAGGPIVEKTGDLSLSGNGTEVGIGFTGIPILAINVSLININYTKADHPFYDQVALANSTVKLPKYTSVLISVSLPLDI